MAELGSVLGGRYRLERILGYGGMSTIFAATDAKLGRSVAVKVLRPEFGADAAFVERFRREAQSAASLSHPNIVAVYDYGTDAAGPFIVMEQVAGGDLSRVLDERGALPPTAVARTGQQVADALAAAHARGLVHRDIKPGNILLAPDGRVQVADFGIAQAAADSPVTSSGIAIGSVLYFSPEQARGDPAPPGVGHLLARPRPLRDADRPARLRRGFAGRGRRGPAVRWGALSERAAAGGARAAGRDRPLVPRAGPRRPPDRIRAVRLADPVPRRSLRRGRVRVDLDVSGRGRVRHRDGGGRERRATPARRPR